MTLAASSRDALSDEPQGPPVDDASRRAPTGTELLVGGSLVLVALTAWLSLMLADAGAHSLGHVILLLAIAAVVVGAIVLRFRPLGRIRLDGPALLAVLGIGVVTGVLFFPGFPYGITEKDPGVYVASGWHIARTGDVRIYDVLGTHVPNLRLASPGARMPGIWALDAAHHVFVPQFYHLWPALMATSYDVTGRSGIVNLTPFVALLSVLAFALLLRRVVPGRASLPAAVIGGLLLASNMLEVWHAKYPTSESMAQMLFVGGLLWLVISIQSGWRPAAAFGGVLFGIGWLERADFLVPVLLSLGVVALLIVLRRWDNRAWWFLGGLAITVPHALYQNYHLAESYTVGNGVPREKVLIALVVAMFVLAFALRFATVPTTWINARIGDRRWQFGIGFAICTIALALMVLGFLRPRIQGPLYVSYLHHPIRSYDEESIRRLGWFLTLPGFAVLGLGIAVFALRRWTSSLWAVAYPTLVIVPIYAWHTRNSPRLMWWSRRFVSDALPGLIAFIAIALAVALVWRYRRRVVLAIPALGVFAYLLATFLSQSWPLHSHHEYAGSFKMSAQIASVSGNKLGVYLWPRLPCCEDPTFDFATAVWLERGETSALLPTDPNTLVPYITRVAKGMPGSPVFLVWPGQALPPQIPSSSVRRIQHIVGALPMWEESEVHRPSHERPPIPIDITVWRWTGT